MIQCPKCSADNLPESRFCSSCGEELSSLSQAPTVAAPEGGAPQAPVKTPHMGRIVSSDSVPAGGFTPGTILADRYRIIGLLGRGGMGEVYRADDLKLGQPVALKFLPPALAEDSVRRERFFAEVRITRQLSHPNICRVYDIGEVDGRHFLSMEYIDGEDLASLMKRIGHLSNEKALDIARQLVAGLSVAHERGVLHRDLKPANIMLDGHGRVRITDFGLAIAAEDEAQAEEIAGTPAYMAPEQLAGKGATVRSDIYSLGLILYEIYTGKKAFKAQTLAELREQKETQTPRAPSELRDGIDPVVERVIQRCMEKDPGSRPASVAQLAQALPGGDPLAAAIAAGETPSPEMVAASGSQEGLKPWITWACLAFIILGIGGAVAFKLRYALYERVPMENPPEVMAAKAREILKSMGYPEPPETSAFGFEPNNSYFSNVEKVDQSSSRFNQLPDLAIQFWYRQSPQAIPSASEFTLTDPPLTNPGDAVVLLDSAGNLIGLQVIPPEAPRQSGGSQLPNWSVLFESAGIEQEKLNDTEPDQTYLAYDDTREAWTGTLPDRPDIPIRIDAAARGGIPVWWRLIAPYREETLKESASLTSITVIISAATMAFLALIGGAFFARRNLRMGRGDRRGAARLAWFILALMIIARLFAKHYLFDVGTSFGDYLIISGMVWLIYIALEPFVRRRWPSVLVGWSRLLSGDFRNPVVGRDLLIGCGLGILTALLYYLKYPLVSFLNFPQLRPSTGALERGVGTFSSFSGTPALSKCIGSLVVCIVLVLLIGFILFLARIILRRTWIAVAVLVILLAGRFAAGEASFVSSIPIILSIGIGIFTYFRFGLLALAVSMYIFLSTVYLPITTKLSALYFEIGLTGLVLLLVFALYAFYTSLGGRPMFGTARLDD